MVHPSDLQVQYGKYTEAEASLEGVPETEKVDWSVIGSSLPMGLELEASQKKDILIFGTPLFTGYWCTALSAKVLSTGKTMFEEVCYYGDDNEEFLYPHFMTERLLPIGYTHQFYQERIRLDRTTATSLKKGEIVEGTLPTGFFKQI